MKKIWEIKNNLEFRIKNLKFRRKEITAILLKNRGLTSKKQIAEFLNPPNPYILTLESLHIKRREITKPIKRIEKAIKNHEQIIVYGDYDADGICATAIMWETLHFLGARVMPFIPDRERHGYGLNEKGIKEILTSQQLAINNQRLLIITVDNGIVASKAVDYCNKKGIDVIVTDHHQPPKKLPNAYSIIWSDRISGAGVAWFLAREIYQYFKKSLLGFKASNTLELACIGTVCDLMPLLKTNRSIVKFGLKELQQTKRQGMLALITDAGVDQQNLGTYEIGYIIGPRLNAMGRLANALDSLRLLCTPNKKRAEDLAQKLGLTNRERQQLTQETFEHAKRKSKLKSQKAKLLFIGDESYNQGVIGLVAGKLVEEFYRPAVVISKGKEYSKASARSIKGFDIIQTLRKFGHLFEDVGGHPMAAGFTIKTNKLEKLQKSLEKYAQSKLSKEDLQPRITADCQIDLTDISWELYNKIEKFSPFGLANPKPVFVSKDVKVAAIRQVGREGKHLKLRIQSTISNQQLAILDSIAFNLGHLASKISPGDNIEICYCLEKNVWNRNESLELKIKDIIVR